MCPRGKRGCGGQLERRRDQLCTAPCSSRICPPGHPVLSSKRSAESVDRIYALNILEHLTKDDLVAVLEQSQRCLRRGGQLIAMVPNATSPFGTMTRYWDFTHLAAFTPSSVRQLQRLCGFRSIEYREWGPRPHGLTSTIRYLLWQAIRGMIWFRLMVETASAKGGIYTADMLFRLTK